MSGTSKAQILLKNKELSAQNYKRKICSKIKNSNIVDTSLVIGLEKQNNFLVFLEFRFSLLPGDIRLPNQERSLFLCRLFKDS